MSLSRLVSTGIALLSLGGWTQAADGPITLVETGAVWRYLDAGQVAGQGWTEVDFNDGNWKVGRAPFGYGRGNEATVLDFGSNPQAKPITTYFRHVFDLEDPSVIRRLIFRLVRDDAAVMYLNGEQVWRSNLRSFGVVGPDTPATNQVTGIEGIMAQPVDAWPGHLTNRNVVAVELHQYSPSDPDAWFDMPVVANVPHGLPSVSWISPTNTSILPWEDLSLSVSASDEDSSIWIVEFYADGRLLGNDYTEPFNLGWFDPPLGSARLHAEAVDNTGRRAITETIVVQLGEPGPDRVVRGPYLQAGAPDRMTICWRTDWFTEARVWYGTSAGHLTNTVDGAAPSLDQEIRLSGLVPATKYFYAVGTTTEILSSGSEHYFVTSPVAAQPLRIWAIGDSGTANEAAREVYEAYLGFTNARHTDVWLMLGDNAYESGTDVQYQRAVFDLYRWLLPNTVLWPTIGNHDQAYPNQFGRIPYQDIFTLPQAGEAGGIASGTERYYSFDHGQVHFICLDSSESDRSVGSPMLQWLESDLANTNPEWLIAFWHHPPYTFGTHNSDTERDLIEMRQNVLPILESHGVDLVLCGHSHNYERSFLLQGHYGFSATFLEDMIVDRASGNPALDHAYQIPSGESAGTVYTVCGCSGEGGLDEVDLHPAMYTAFGGYGSMVIDIDGTRLEARMLNNGGVIRDLFVIEKGESQAGQDPVLRLRHTATGIELVWPASTPLSYRLETSVGGTYPWDWAPALGAASVMGDRYVLALETVDSQRFYRLQRE